MNIATPNSQAMSQRLRHIIEYNYEENSDNKKRRLKGNDIVKNKAVVYLKLYMIKIRIEQINITGSEVV